MSYGWQVLIRSVVKQRKLERSIDYSRLSESDGKKLIQGFKGVVLEGEEGYFFRPYYSYFFIKMGSNFYFETSEREELPDTRLVVRTRLIEVPR